MSFELERKPEYTLITIKGEKLDSSIAPALKSELVLLNADGVKFIVLDLHKVRYCDSSGLSAILVANRLCKNALGYFVITGLQDAVKKLITISQLDAILNIAETRQLGLDRLSEQLKKAWFLNF